MTSGDSERFPVYLRVYLGNEEERTCENGHCCTSSAAKCKPGTEIRWALVFMFKKSVGLRYEVFLKDEAFQSGLSHVLPDQIEEWARKGELVKIQDLTLSSDDVFQAFRQVGPKGEVPRPAGTCNSLVMKLLGELGIPWPNDLEDMAKRCSSGDLKSHVKELRSLFGDDSQSDSLQENPTDNQSNEKSRKQEDPMQMPETSRLTFRFIGILVRVIQAVCLLPFLLLDATTLSKQKQHISLNRVQSTLTSASSNSYKRSAQHGIHG